jgi:hypothetical protein
MQPADRAAPGTRGILAPEWSQPRLGVEYVTTDHAAGEAGPPEILGLGESPLGSASVGPRRRGAARSDASKGGTPSQDLAELVAEAVRNRPVPIWRMRRKDIDALERPADRMTVRFIKEVLGYDKERIHNELGPHFVEHQYARVTDRLSDAWIEEQRAADEEEALQELTSELLQRPVRRALREIPLVRGLELMIDDYKADNVPTSGAYRDVRDQARRDWGQVSLRLRHQDGSDPLAVTYSQKGWRFGLSKETVRLGYSTPFLETLWLHVGTSYDHERNRYAVSTELQTSATARTRVRFSVGNYIDAYPGSSVDRIIRDDSDPGPGAMMYVEHIF